MVSISLQLNKELEEQNSKIERVGKQNAKYAREIRSARKLKGQVPEEVGHQYIFFKHLFYWAGTSIFNWNFMFSHFLCFFSDQQLTIVFLNFREILTFERWGSLTRMSLRQLVMPYTTIQTSPKRFTSISLKPICHHLQLKVYDEHLALPSHSSVVIILRLLWAVICYHWQSVIIMKLKHRIHIS